jgi:dihydroorotase
VRPHHYCLPVLKREADRVALLAAATSGDPRFFLGTDSAPHARLTKEAACGCAGIYSAHAAIEFYAEAFEAAGALDRLEGFASEFGPRFYGLPLNDGRITLEKRDWTVPTQYPFAGGDTLVPLRAGESLAWRLTD